jgi:hypothetical protein
MTITVLNKTSHMLCFIRHPEIVKSVISDITDKAVFMVGTEK